MTIDPTGATESIDRAWLVYADAMYFLRRNSYYQYRIGEYQPYVWRKIPLDAEGDYAAGTTAGVAPFAAELAEAGLNDLEWARVIVAQPDRYSAVADAHLDTYRGWEVIWLDDEDRPAALGSLSGHPDAATDVHRFIVAVMAVVNPTVTAESVR